MKDKIIEFFGKLSDLALFPGDVLKTKKSRKLFIWLCPLWIIYLCLFLILLIFIGGPICFILFLIDKFKEARQSIKGWINSTEESIRDWTNEPNE